MGSVTIAIACGGGTQSAPATPAPQPVAPAAKPQAVAAAPAAPAPVVSGPSTLDGVYSTEQADRGKDVYMGTCRSCHTAAFFTGPNFENHWKGKALSDLYTYVATKMPGNDPGSLSSDAVADVLAFMLQVNKLPAGANEIYPEADSLKRFRIAISSTSK